MVSGQIKFHPISPLFPLLGKDQLKRLTADFRRLPEKAERGKDYRAALAGARELAPVVELVARLTGKLQERNQTNAVNVQLDPEMTRRVAETYLPRNWALEIVNGGGPPPGDCARARRSGLSRHHSVASLLRSNPPSVQH